MSDSTRHSFTRAITQMRALRRTPVKDRLPNSGLDYAMRDLQSLEQTADETGLADALDQPELLGNGSESTVTRMNDALVLRHNSARGVVWARSSFIPQRPPIAQVMQAYDSETDIIMPNTTKEDAVTREVLPNFKHTPHYQLTSATDHTREAVELFFALWKFGYYAYDLAYQDNVVRCTLPGREPVLILNEPGALGLLAAASPSDEDKIEGVLSFLEAIEDDAPDVYAAICGHDTALFASYGMGDIHAINAAADEPEPSEGWQRIRAAVDAMAEQVEVDFSKWNGVQEPLGFFNLQYAPHGPNAARVTAETLYPPSAGTRRSGR